MRALATIALGLSEIMLDRSVLKLRSSVEVLVLRLGLVVICVLIGAAAGGFFLAAIYDFTAAAWGGIAAKVFLGGLLACTALAIGLVMAFSRPRTRRSLRRL